MFALLVVVPLVLSAIAALLMRGREGLVGYAALAGSIGSLAIAIALYLQGGTVQQITWFSAGAYIFQISATTAPLHMLLLLLVAAVTPLVMLYSIGFMRAPSEQRSYYFEMSVFAAAMMLFAVGADLITIFVGWELLGITSYLLIGFWHYKESAVEAARKAITIVFIGDLMVFGSIVMLGVLYHTFSISGIITAGSAGGLARLAVALMIFGAFTKAAQFPFHEWLPDAMEGPTPVSAFLHSSTMVKAGVFLIAVILPLVSAMRLSYLLLWFGIATAAIGAVSALSETHVKRILAYSTIEDLGLMFVALGLHSILAAMMLFLAQTFYKALLFFGAGCVMRVNPGEEDIRRLEGPRGHPYLLAATAIGAASLAGIFPLGGFFGKLGIEGLAGNYYIYAVLLAIDMASSLYIFRWLLVPLSPRNRDRAGRLYASLPKSMLAPTYALAALVCASGLGYLYLGGYLGLGGLAISYGGALALGVVVIAGAVFAYALYYARSFVTEGVRSRIVRAAYSAPFVNATYRGVAGAFEVGGDVAEALDYHLYAFIKGGSYAVGRGSEFIRRIESGRLGYYLIVFVAGIIAMIMLMLVV